MHDNKNVFMLIVGWNDETSGEVDGGPFGSVEDER
jgi:hypothetical protein